MRPWACLICTVAAAACGDDGLVRLRIDLPEDPALSPLGSDTAAELTLRAEAEGLPPEVLSRPYDPLSGQTDFGELPIHDGVWLSMEVESPGGTLLGYGRSGAAVEVEAGRETTVELLLRKPFAYLAGASRLLVMDTTADQGQKFDGEAPAALEPDAVVVTPDGATVMVARGDSITFLSTSDHQPITGALDLGTAITDLGISPDSRWAVALHANGVTIFDLRTGMSARVDLPSAGGVAVSDDRAYVLLSPGDGGSCAAGTSSIVSIPLEDPTGATAPLNLETQGADLTWEPRNGALLVAAPCTNGVLRVSISGDALASEMLMPVSTPTVVAATRDRIFAVGRSNQGQGAFLILASAESDGSGATQVALPPVEERARADEFSVQGQEAEVRVTADTVRPRDLAVLPGSQRVAVLVYAEFHGDAVWYGDVFPTLVIPELSLVTWEYQLLDAPTGVALQRLRTYCQADAVLQPGDPEPIVQDLSCTRNAGQDVSAYFFVPSHVAVLYGDR